jgi:hypothetical protein
MSNVSVLKTSPKTILDDYQKLMDLADYKSAVPKDNATILKINLSWSLFYPACSTPPWQLDGVLSKLRQDSTRTLPVWKIRR